jgi:large subunit ribosomal protein L20
MPRVKGGSVARKRRKKILKLAKGYFGSKRTLYRTAHEQVMRSLAYAYRDRKQKKREFRKLWIQRINAAAKANQMKYSTLIHGLSLANVAVNRKMLADIAVFQPEDFTAYCKLAKDALNGKLAPKEVVAPKKVVAPKVEAVKVETPKVEVKAPAASTKEVVEAVDYSKMLVKDLKAIALEKGIEGADKMLKADLVKALS